MSFSPLIDFRKTFELGMCSQNSLHVAKFSKDLLKIYHIINKTIDYRWQSEMYELKKVL